MKKILQTMILTATLCLTLEAQELFTEVQAALVQDGPLHTFRVVGDREEGAFSAYGILIIAPNGDEQMVDEFDSLLPDGSEADALIVEDLNFDGYSDMRIMKYALGGSNINYYYWLYDPISAAFQSSSNLEVLVSPEVDRVNQEILSRRKLNANSYLVEYYKAEGGVLTMVRKDEKTYNPDGSGTLKRTQANPDGTWQVLETRNLNPGE